MKKIALASVYSHDLNSYHMYIGMLYRLLEERKPHESISHKKMPILNDHSRFVDSHPYQVWYMIQSMEEADYPIVGAIYLNHNDSIGISIFNKYKRQHYGCSAIRALMDEHPRNSYSANINPDNHNSKELFKRIGFKFYKTEKCKNNTQDVYIYLPNQEA